MLASAMLEIEYVAQFYSHLFNCINRSFTAGGISHFCFTLTLTMTIDLFGSSFLQHSKTVVLKSETRKPKPDDDSLVFGQHMSDHMLTLEWNSTSGWKEPVIKPHENLNLDPSASVFHYGSEVRT